MGGKCVYQEYAKDEETLKAVYQSVNAVVGILRSSNEDLPSRPGILHHFLAMHPVATVVLSICPSVCLSHR